MSKPIEVFRYIIKVPKQHSSFLYFILEACDGMCFYSTLNYEVGWPFRRIEINTTEWFRPELERLCQKLADTLSLVIEEKGQLL